MRFTMKYEGFVKLILYALVIIIVILVFGIAVILTQNDKTELNDKTPSFDLEKIREQNMIELAELPFDLRWNDNGANVVLDQKIYTWTDKVYITIVAPSHNFDSNSVDEIGNLNTSKITISTSNHLLNQYKLVETGKDTGIFTGEIILTGFRHNVDGNSLTGIDGMDTQPRTIPSINGGPTDGYLETGANDLITIMFMTRAYTVITLSNVTWNIGEAQWLEASYPASGAGIVRVVDPDMNLEPESIDSFKIKVWSDEDPIGINLNVTETNEATGIFEVTVFFHTVKKSSVNTLRVSEGNTIYAKYEDHTLPEPYSMDDKLPVNATANILPRRVTSVVNVSFDS